MGCQLENTVKTGECGKIWLVRLKQNSRFGRIDTFGYEGKINIIKSIGLSSIQYAMQMQTVDLKELDKLLLDFLWSGKVHRVSKNICIQPKISGGLGMVDIHTVINVKRIQWITRLLKADEMESWAWLPLKYIKSFDIRFFLFYRQIIPENWW